MLAENIFRRAYYCSGWLRLMSLMSRVWQAHLLPEDLQLLQLAEFRVLAVTPNAGYVPGGKPWMGSMFQRTRLSPGVNADMSRDLYMTLMTILFTCF